MILEALGATARYPGAPHPAIEGLDLRVAPGELVAVAGPNGSGKTSLVRALLGLLPLEAGLVSLDGRAIGEWPRQALARVLGVVPQREEMGFSWRVEEMVTFGRYARLGPLAPVSAADRAAVARAMARADVAALASRRVETLSGGEWQRVRIARALAQEPRVLVLDEPTAALDLGHEMELFELVRGLVGEGIAGLVITHHLNLAARFADRILLLDAGRVAVQGPPEEVFVPGRLEAIFDWPVSIVPLPDGTPQVVPNRRGTGGGYS